MKWFEMRLIDLPSLTSISNIGGHSFQYPLGLNEVYRSSAGNADCLIEQDQQDWEQHL